MAISPRIFEKFRNNTNGRLRGLGETDSRKNLKVAEKGLERRRGKGIKEKDGKRNWRKQDGIMD
jgi:hypothetical protein